MVAFPTANRPNTHVIPSRQAHANAIFACISCDLCEPLIAADFFRFFESVRKTVTNMEILNTRMIAIGRMTPK